MSRADLSRRSGLQRSTVSAIVDQLIAEGWVTEGAIGRLPRGRRPRFLHLNVERTGIVGVNLRPETTTVGLANVDARFEAQRSFPTPSDPPAFVRTVARTIASLRAAHPRMVCEGIGVSLPGRVDEAGRLVFAPNLGWRDVDLRRMLESATGLPVNVENAANACALGELWFGRHDEHIRHLVAVTVSEGIGVGVLLNGQLVRGANAMAGEFGHMTFDETGPPCCCGKRGCWERYASNSAAVDYYTSGGQAKRGQPQPGLRFEDILRLAAAGDRRAIETLERMAEVPRRGPGHHRHRPRPAGRRRHRRSDERVGPRRPDRRGGARAAGAARNADAHHPDRPRDAAATARRGDARHPAAFRRAQRRVDSQPRFKAGSRREQALRRSQTRDTIA